MSDKNSTDQSGSDTISMIPRSIKLIDQSSIASRGSKVFQKNRNISIEIINDELIINIIKNHKDSRGPDNIIKYPIKDINIYYNYEKILDHFMNSKLPDICYFIISINESITDIDLEIFHNGHNRLYYNYDEYDTTIFNQYIITDDDVWDLLTHLIEISK